MAKRVQIDIGLGRLKLMLLSMSRSHSHRDGAYGLARANVQDRIPDHENTAGGNGCAESFLGPIHRGAQHLRPIVGIRAKEYLKAKK